MPRPGEERMKGLEPSTFARARRRSSQLSYIRVGAEYRPGSATRDALGWRPQTDAR